MSIREVIVNEIERYRVHEQNFPKDTMKWKDLYLSKTEGIVRCPTKKSQKGNIHLSETISDDFWYLTDTQLVDALVRLVTQIGKQM
jgi:hypothetical protein